MKYRLYLAIALLCGLLGSAFAENRAIVATQLQVKEFMYRGAPTQSTLPDVKSFKGITVDWIKYEWMKCDVNWDQTCKGESIIEAPQGWQVCKPLYTVASNNNHTSYSVTPDKWYTNDPESPDRFRAEIYTLGATGSGNIFDQWGSNIQLNNVGIQLISAEANNEARYRAGCVMPSHD